MSCHEITSRSLVIKKADKSSCVVVWDRKDYIAEAKRQLGDVSVYKEVDFKEKMLQDLGDSSNKLFGNPTEVSAFLDSELTSSVIQESWSYIKVTL